MKPGSAVVAVSTTAAIVVLLGAQGLAPVTPGIRDEFALDEAAISAFTLVYLLGAAVLGFPATALADRIGIRPVLAVSLLVFGGFGIWGSFLSSYPGLLGVRLVQGAAFGTVVALTIVLTSVDGSPVESARRLRIRAMLLTLGEAVLPALVGVVATPFGWRVGFGLQSVAMLVAVLCFWVIPADARGKRKTSTGGSVRLAVRALFTPFGFTAQLPSVTRFIVKFAIITYIPIFAADVLGLNPATTGMILGLGALMAVVSASFAPKLLAQAGSSWAFGLATALVALPLVFTPLVFTPMVLIVIIVVSGVGDGLIGVYGNVLTTASAPPDAKAAYLGLSGTVRNASKVAAPTMLALLVFVMPLAFSLGTVGLLALLPVLGIRVAGRGVDATVSNTDLDSSGSLDE